MDTDLQEKQIVEAFSVKMLKKIQARHNRYTPLGWKTMDTKRLLTLLKGEIEEYIEALENEEKEYAKDEAIDIANYALFLHEVL